GAALVVLAPPDLATPLREERFDAPVTAVAANGRTLAVATQDGVVAIGSRFGAPLGVRIRLGEPAARLHVAPGGDRLLAVAASQRAWIANREGEVVDTHVWLRFGRAAFVRRDLVVHGAAGEPALFALFLPPQTSAPFLDSGIGVGALAASVASERVAVAFGANLHLTGPVGPHAQAVGAARLVDGRR
ncbi:MAG: hypothetical protein DCC71_26020, partial [Proteobacteria bacterium]